MVACAMSIAGIAHADPIADASLRAVTNRDVRLELAEGFLEGKLLAFEATTVTVAIAATREVIDRAKLLGSSVAT
jgi:hypothetical protein